MHVVFDLDGCLIDTRDLIINAYTRAGAPPPANILDYEGIDWLADWQDREAIRARKNAYYITKIREGDYVTLPPYSTAVRIYKEGGRCDFLTGAPIGTVEAFHHAQWQKTWSWPFTEGLDGARTPVKMILLARYSETGVYVDDQDRLIDLPPGWKFIHYVGQDSNDLYDQIKELTK